MISVNSYGYPLNSPVSFNINTGKLIIDCIECQYDGWVEFRLGNETYNEVAWDGDNAAAVTLPAAKPGSLTVFEFAAQADGGQDFRSAEHRYVRLQCEAVLRRGLRGRSLCACGREVRHGRSAGAAIESIHH